ncbi:hypothetical protein MRX96_039322 [Rhipicephalus microplus]
MRHRATGRREPLQHEYQRHLGYSSGCDEAATRSNQPSGIRCTARNVLPTLSKLAIPRAALAATELRKPRVGGTRMLQTSRSTANFEEPRGKSSLPITQHGETLLRPPAVWFRSFFRNI